MLASLLGMGALRRSATARNYFGLVERAFYVAALALLAVVGARLTAAH
jgi:hypothetical protein